MVNALTRLPHRYYLYPSDFNGVTKLDGDSLSLLNVKLKAPDNRGFFFLVFSAQRDCAAFLDR